MSSQAIEKPKNRRKTYRFFKNLDYVEFKGEVFIRLPNEREHHHLSREKAKTFADMVLAKAKSLQRNPMTLFVDGSEVPRAMHPAEMFNFAVSTARELIHNGEHQKTS